MLIAIAPARPQRPGAIFPTYHGGEAKQQPAQPGGKEVGHIVKTGADHADRPVFFVLIADHGIEGVDRLIGHGQRRAAEQQEEERRDNAVDGVFRHGFHHRAVNLLRLELCGVAPDNPRQLATAFRQIPRAQRSLDVPRRLRQTAPRQHGEDHPYLHQPSQPGVDPARQRQYAPGHSPRQAGHHQPHHSAADAQRPLAMADAPHHALADVDQTTYPAHRMRPVRRIANDDIKYPGYTPGEKGHSALLAARNQWLSMVGRWAKWTWR